MYANERWKDIPGHEGCYQVSDMGRVKSLTRTITVRGHSGLTFRKKITGRILSPAGSKRDPHLRVVLGRDPTTGKQRFGALVHQLVLLSFVGPASDGLEVRHLNGNPTDNRLENLRYGTRTENILDVFRIGRAWRKLTREQADAIKRQLASGATGVSLAKEYGVSQAIISAIKHGRIHNAPLGR